MKREKAWVWFKGDLKEGGYWVSGFLASSCDEEGLLIERSDFVSCRVPEWRVTFAEPENEKNGPKIPEGAIWKFS